MNLATIDIESAFRGWLLSNPSTGMDVAASRAKRAVREMLGNAIFAGRVVGEPHKYRPANESVTELAATIERQSVGREYVLDGESDWAQPNISLVLYGRNGSRPGTWVKRLAEMIRLCTSHFTGSWEYASDSGPRIGVEIDSALIVSESELPVIATTKTSERWQYRYRVAWQITHNQTPIIRKSATSPSDQPGTVPPPPPPKGIGYDTIGVDNTIL